MEKVFAIVILLGCASFLVKTSWGLGWLLGWLFLAIRRWVRQRIFDWIFDSKLDFKSDFKSIVMTRYMTYLILSIIWIAIPILIGFFKPEVINPLAVFAAYFAERILLFIVNSNEKVNSNGKEEEKK